MSAYSIALWSLIAALLTQSIAAVLSVEFYLRKDLPRGVCRTWLALAIVSLLLALQHGYSLELAVRIGLYDMRQALLAGLVGIFFLLGIYRLRRQQA
ncbi:MAG: hypothetical protein U0989_09465 [Azonexus sp.]|nr:hypothetical protein [Azonexus sp.]MDP3637240.1 hypothetical protein [Azonexus sp.]MDZ4314979.1 hypothetical protein [Azonexus sp.]